MNPLSDKISSGNGNGSASATPREGAVVETAHPAKPKLGRWLLAIAILFIGGVIVGLVPRFRHREVLARETIELGTPTVNVVSAVPGKATASLTLPAEVRAMVEAPIYSRANGYLKKWHVDIGARVEAGQPLADVDAPELDQELTGARAGLAQAEAALALARTTAVRWAELLKTSSVSDQENAEKQADLALKEANVDAAKANMHRLEDLQSFTHVTAPFAGIITARDIDVGDLITSGKELFRMAQTRTLRVFVRVPQSATAGIGVGVDAEMTVPEMPGRKFMAKVVRTAGAIDVASRTLLTELEVDNSKDELLAGSYAQVSFGEMKQAPALVLPSNTLIFRADGLQVGVVAEDGKVELKKVTLGRDFGKTVEILAGVSAADRVVLNPSDSLISGTVVSVGQMAVAGKGEGN